MKKILFNAAFLLAGLFTLNSVSAQEKEKHERTEPKFKKEKSYSKSYSLSGSDRVNLSNQFGEMKLVTWEKNEIKVDVSITGKSDDEKRAQEIIDKISIIDSKEGNNVSFKTKFADDRKDHDNDGNKEENKNRQKHRNEGMEINYLVYLPAGNPLKVENQFGKMIIPDYRGEAEITSKFGSLTAGNIYNAKSVNVEFGQGDIAQVNGGRLEIKFSNGTVKKLTGNVRSDLEFSNVKLMIGNDAKGLDIHNSYSAVYLDLDKNLSASFDISTSHGEFTNKSDFTIKKEGSDESGYGPKFTNHYTGTAGNGGMAIKVISSFGSITTGHNLQMDLTDKHKNRSKNKTTKTI
jgi:hypothetical protein